MREKQFNLWIEQERIFCKPSFSFPDTISPINSTSRYPHSLYRAEERGNHFEERVIEELSSNAPILWWHRNISKVGFAINGPLANAYPDLIVCMRSGKILLVETKGDFLENQDSSMKARIGAQWDKSAGEGFRYFMAFETNSPKVPGAYSYEAFLKIVEGL